jgi:hypothetical protein
MCHYRRMAANIYELYSQAIAAERAAWAVTKGCLPGTTSFDPEIWEAWRLAAAMKNCLPGSTSFDPRVWQKWRKAAVASKGAATC